MKVGDLVIHYLEKADQKRSNVVRRNPLGLGLIVKPDPAGVMFYVQWSRDNTWGSNRGWYATETLVVVNENR